jgi:hypothetical protein
MTSSKTSVSTFAKRAEGKHSRHRSPFNFLVNLVSGLIAYAYHPDKPSLGIPDYELKALPQAAF